MNIINILYIKYDHYNNYYIYFCVTWYILSANLLASPEQKKRCYGK